MSNYIPDEIQLEIMKRFPVKSLIRFRSVSKTWKSVIGNSDFIIKHYKCHNTHSHSQHTLVKYIHNPTWDDDPIDNHFKFISVFDDGTFPEYVPILVKMVKYPCVVIGSSHGLMCLQDSKKGVVLLWNVSIRKVVGVFVPRIRHYLLEETFLGFGVCGETNDPKIFKIDKLRKDGMGSVTGIHPDVQVFTLSTGAWRNSYGNLPRESIEFVPFSGVVINGVYYWLANDRNSMDGDWKYVIVSFDMTSEEFGEITVPCSLSYAEIFKLRESLVIVDRHEHCDGYNTDHAVWMMGDGVPKSFTKLFTFTRKQHECIIGFRKNGEPIIDGGEELLVYDPHKKRFNSLGIEGRSYSHAVYDYMETLLLLDKPNFMVYNDF